MNGPLESRPAAAGPCDHPADAIAEGPRVRRRWGTGPTRACGRCGAWRMYGAYGWVGAWRPGPVVPAGEETDDDE